MKQAKQQEMPQRAMRRASRVLFRVLHEPLFVRTGLRNWKRKIVPVGRSFIRFPRPEKVFAEAVEAVEVVVSEVVAVEDIREVVLEEEDEAPMF